MAPRSSSAHRRTVRVDVTAHKEERNVADTRKKTSLRARYYVELVVGSVHERHVRLGFSGSFKKLLELHQTFVRAYLDKYSSSSSRGSDLGVRPSLSSSTSSTTSRSSLSSSSPRGVTKLLHTLRLKKHMPTEPNSVGHVHSSSSSNQTEDIALPYMPAFPASSKLLVKLESSAATDDSKISARVAALFEYYSELFNSDESELFLEIVQTRSIAQSAQHAAENNNSSSSSRDDEAPSTRTGLFKLLARRAHDKSADDAFKRLEFLPPVQVSSAGKVRPLKHVKTQSESAASRFR